MSMQYSLVGQLCVYVVVKVRVSVEGPNLPDAVLEYIRNNDVTILEACDKVCI